jgi:dTDP-4-amino-4,6-dideoxygalactose transaminase
MNKELKVKFFDYPLQYGIDKKEYLKIIDSVLSRGAYILSEDLERFEKNFARFCRVKYAVGVGNCTEALFLSLLAAGIKSGDQVISVSHTFVATIETIKLIGAVPVFVDIANDHNMDVNLIEKAINKKTKAIIPVHLNGRVCSNMDKLMQIAAKYKLLVIEDAAQSLGASYKGKFAGTFGTAGAFSFYPAKLLGAFGDAGAVITNDSKIAEKIKLLRNHGRGNGLDINSWGFNCRMDNLHSAILDYKLKKLKRWIKRRREIAQTYFDALSFLSNLSLPPTPDLKNEHFDVFQNYEIEAQNRDELMEFLKKKGIQTILPWGGKAVHQFPGLKLTKYNLPVTERIFRRVLMLPLYPELTDKQVKFVANSIKEFYRA